MCVCCDALGVVRRGWEQQDQAPPVFWKAVLRNLPLGTESHLSARARWASEENQSPLARPLGMQIGAPGEVGSSPLILLSWISKGIFPVL